MSRIDLEADGFITARDNREGQPDRQHPMIKKILNKLMCFGCVSDQLGYHRLRSGNGLQAKRSDALAKLLNSLLEILQPLESYGAVA